jgi:hypothetical protein
MTAIGTMERIAEQMEEDDARLQRIVARRTKMLETDLAFMRTQALDLANQVNTGRTIIRELVAEIGSGPVSLQDVSRVERMGLLLSRAMAH